MTYEEQQLREALNRALMDQKTNTARWYSGMSGERPFREGEKDTNNRQFEANCKRIDGLTRQIEGYDQ